MMNYKAFITYYDLIKLESYIDNTMLEKMSKENSRAVLQREVMYNSNNRTSMCELNHT